MMPESRVSLQDVATRAGVSRMTVSRVLRNSPRVSETTRQQVLEAVSALHYQPDPELTRAMALVRDKTRKTGFHSVLGVIRERIPHDDVDAHAYQFVAVEAIRDRAASYGYLVEEFWLGFDGLTPRRLSNILCARGIEGIIVSPQSSRLPCREIDYSRFSSVTFGFALREPSLHRSSCNMIPGIRAAFAQLEARGYQRIGIAITQWVDERSQNVYSSGALHFQQHLADQSRVPVFIFPHNDFSKDAEVFLEWVARHQPDAVISFDTLVPDWLRRAGLRIPEDIGFVVHDWVPGMSQWAGIHHRRADVARAGVDLLVMQLMHHERGLPEVPLQISVPPLWVDGPSIRPL